MINGEMRGASIGTTSSTVAAEADVEEGEGGLLLLMIAVPEIGSGDEGGVAEVEIRLLLLEMVVTIAGVGS